MPTCTYIWLKKLTQNVLLIFSPTHPPYCALVSQRQIPICRGPGSMTVVKCTRRTVQGGHCLQAVYLSCRDLSRAACEPGRLWKPVGQPPVIWSTSNANGRELPWQSHNASVGKEWLHTVVERSVTVALNMYIYINIYLFFSLKNGQNKLFGIIFTVIC